LGFDFELRLASKEVKDEKLGPSLGLRINSNTNPQIELNTNKLEEIVANNQNTN